MAEYPFRQEGPWMDAATHPFRKLHALITLPSSQKYSGAIGIIQKGPGDIGFPESR